ncbi:non-homologous end-joining DNA ligase [Devosia nitrariae]|uniref:DNA ligase (ATP) n=1 Tax=Devosia nitrariae TaxID=2071872 RepID=A0ABQ5W1E1_9HYPH|nr:non-homologous end-joining DNA ligase [Devosia nitrariae]GLQ53624.1 hypothetical protein GCM10010862_08830 [Devosia nitrariae]
MPKPTLPAFRPFQLAKLVDRIPDGDDWLFEMKFDGYRCQAVLSGDRVTLFSRSGLDWTRTFQYLVPAFEKLTKGTASIDGEVVAIDTEGRANFNLLQRSLKLREPIVFYAFDLLEENGEDLRSLPLIERKTRLEALLGERAPSDPIQYSTHIVGHGQQVFDRMCAGGHEGVIAKRLNARYQSGDRSPTWLKVKCTKRREFIVIGWRTNEQGEDLRAFHLAEEVDGELVYRGRVGSGITDRERPGFLGAVELIEIDEPVLTVPREERKLGRWIEPRLIADVAFTEITEEGTLRHPSFKGIRVRE